MKIIVDTSVWIEYLKNRPSVTGVLDHYLLTGKAFTVGPVIAELLQGAKTEQDYNALKNSIDGLPYLETNLDDWVLAGRVSFKLRKQGITIPITDCIIAALAINRDAAVMSLDQHFEFIPDLKLEPTPT
jgi:tRNA(fMet)-specific endonuclease VapC